MPSISLAQTLATVYRTAPATPGVRTHAGRRGRVASSCDSPGFCEEFAFPAFESMQTTDGDHFSGDLARGGGVWVAPGVPTPVAVGYYNNNYEDPPGLPGMRQGPGWREVLIDGDTTFDIELVPMPSSHSVIKPFSDNAAERTS